LAGRLGCSRRTSNAASGGTPDRHRHGVYQRRLVVAGAACGVKNSGYGRELSGAGIQEFVNKLIRVA
jgi:hypothetical protein